MSHSFTPGPMQATDQPMIRSATAVIKDYVAITKPKHQAVLITCWSTMTLAGGTTFANYLLVLLATSLAVASSHVFNQLIDSEFDAKMPRTKQRPLAARRISRRGAVLFGSLLGLLSVALMLWRVNGLSALLVIAGFIVYVIVYSWWLKPRSPWSTLGGGASGAMPTLIGWAAVTGRIDMAPFLLFLFMLIWQSPHFYALSLFRGEEYAKAGLPVVVVAHGVPATLRKILWNTLAMMTPTFLLYPIGAAGVGYLAVASVTGGLYLAGVIAANIQGARHAAQWGKRLFLASYLYMAAIYLSVAVDRL